MQPEWRKLNKIQFRHVEVCPACGSKDYQRLYRKFIMRYEIYFLQCQNCKSIYAESTATEESLRDIYASKNFFEGGEEQINYDSYIGGEHYRVKTAKRRLDLMERFSSGKDLLEVASAAGFFLREAKVRKYNSTGVEFSEPMAKWSSKTWGINVIPESIESIDFPKESFDKIASWGVFTILRNPFKVLCNYNNWLRKDGIIGINTYFSDSLWGKIWGKHWYILVLNTNQILSRKATMNLFERSGFELVYLKKERQYTDSNYLFFQLTNHFPEKIRKRIAKYGKNLNRVVFPIILPDVNFYICRKIRDVPILE